MHVSTCANMGDGGSFEGVGGTGVGCENGGGARGSGGGPQSYLNLGVVIGGRHNGKCPVDYSGPSSDLKRKGKGKGNDSSASMDSLRSDALKEFRDLNRLKKEMMLQDQARMSSGEGSAGVCGSGATFQNSMSRALNILDELAPDLDNHTYLRAFELLQDETICDGFIAMPRSRWKAWFAFL